MMGTRNSLTPTDAEGSYSPRSFLSFLLSPPLDNSLKSIPGNSLSYYQGFYKAHHCDVEHINNQVYVEKSFTSSFFEQMIFTVVPVGGIFIMMRFAWTMSRSAGADAFQKMIDPPRSFLSHFSSKRSQIGAIDIEKKQNRSHIKFSDIIGIDDAKEEVKQYIKFLNDPKKFTRLGARVPKGCLFTGPSGTGKTLMVKAIASEANVPLFTSTGADFINVYLGSGPKMIRQLFEEARENAPSIVFIDEIDAIGDRKPADTSPGSMEDNRTINQLLKELDGLDCSTSGSSRGSSPPVVVFAATNYSQRIDRALLRAGRFDRKIVFPLPDHEARRDLFRYYLSKAKLRQTMPWSSTANHMRPLSQDQQRLLHQLSDISTGLSPASISTIVNNACLSAADDGSEEENFVTEAHLISSAEKILIQRQGHQSGHSSSSSPIKIKARQQSARVVVAWMFPQQEEIVRVSVEGNSYTLQQQGENCESVTVLHLFSTLCVQLAARSIEYLFCEGDSRFHLTPTIQQDVRKATSNVFDQMLSYGMASKTLGALSHRNRANLPKGQIETAISNSRLAMTEKLGNGCMELVHQVVMEVLSGNIEKMVALEKKLMELRSLGFSQVEEILGPRPLCSPLSADQQAKLSKIYSNCWA